MALVAVLEMSVDRLASAQDVDVDNGLVDDGTRLKGEEQLLVSLVLGIAEMVLWIEDDTTSNHLHQRPLNLVPSYHLSIILHFLYDLAPLGIGAI